MLQGAKSNLFTHPTFHLISLGVVAQKESFRFAPGRCECKSRRLHRRTAIDSSTLDCLLRAIHAIPTARLVQQQDTSLPNCEYGCDSHASLWPTKRPFHEPILGRGSPIATRRARARLPLGSRKYRIARSDDDILNSRTWPTSNATPTEGRRGSRPSDLTGYPPVPTDSGTGLRSRMSRFDSSRGD